MNIFKWAIGAVFACGIAYAGLLGTKAEVKEIKEGRREIRSDEFGGIHIMVGKMDTKEKEIEMPAGVAVNVGGQITTITAEEAHDQIACSLDNPEDCEACGS